MDTTKKYKIVDLVINCALDNGASQAAVYINDNTSRHIEIRERKIDRLQESIGNSLSVDLYVDKKYSSHSTNLLKEKDLLKFIKEAVEATRYLSEDEFRYLPDKDLYYTGKGEDLKTLDTMLNSIESKNKIDLARQAEEEVYGTDNRIISVTSYYSDNVTNMILADSNGFRGEAGSSFTGISAEVSVKDDKGRPSDYWGEYSIFYDRLKKTGTGKTAFERAIKKSNPKKIKSGKYKIIVENLVSGNLLNPFISALLGSSIYQKNSFLNGKINNRVASDKLSFYDDPLMISGFGSRYFDNEGLRSVKRDIVEQGILHNYFIDTYYGRKLNLAPTSGSSSNILFKTGVNDLAGLVRSVDKGILITGLNGGNCNGATGDFSYGIEGFYILKGKIVHPVSEMNISGNMKDFWNTLAEVGNDPYLYSSRLTPSMVFEDTDVSGI
jgi:PmbA protein